MSSISVYELRKELEMYPDDYEVIMDWKWREDGESKQSIAYINGIRVDDYHQEVRLMN